MKSLPLCFRLLFVMLLTLLAPGLASAANEIIRQNTKITFDKANFLVFEDVGRVETGNSTTFGLKIVLHATRDGKQVDYTFEKLGFPEIPITTHVYEIRYRDKDKIWIISRLGRRQGAILYNLATRKVDWAIFGTHFSLSPDARHLAYAFLFSYPLPSVRQWVCPAVLVNTVMAYPRVEPGFTHEPEYDTVDTENGTDFWSLLSKEQKGMELSSEIKWLNNGTIEFEVRPSALMDEDIAKPRNHAKRPSQTIRVSGLEDLKNTRTIKINTVTSGTLKSN